MDNNTHNKDRAEKPFSERLLETNIMPDGLLQAVDSTDLAILAIEKGAKETTKEEGS